MVDLMTYALYCLSTKDNEAFFSFDFNNQYQTKAQLSHLPKTLAIGLCVRHPPSQNTPNMGGIIAQGSQLLCSEVTSSTASGHASHGLLPATEWTQRGCYCNPVPGRHRTALIQGLPWNPGQAALGFGNFYLVPLSRLHCMSDHSPSLFQFLLYFLSQTFRPIKSSHIYFPLGAYFSK